MKILVLYTRLTGYWLACMRKDHELTGNEYLVFRTAPSKDAPFNIQSEEGIEIRDFDPKLMAEIRTQITGFQPSLIYISGWSNKHYLEIAKLYKTKGLSIVVGMDNQWLGTVKQHLATVFSKWLIRKYFTHIWVPGKPQYYYARKLGFKPQHILTGLYCADESLFSTITPKEHKKKLTFIGRIVDHKGVKHLFEVVKELISADQFTFELHIIGNGPLEHLIPKHKNIKHTPFINPEKLPELMLTAGTFVLPSTYEAWGVVIHEAALAGLPIITTYQSGAATELVIDHFNGYKYDAHHKASLKKIILNVMGQSVDEYDTMSTNSKFLGSQINLTNWSAQINSLNKVSF